MGSGPWSALSRLMLPRAAHYPLGPLVRPLSAPLADDAEPAEAEDVVGEAVQEGQGVRKERRAGQGLVREEV